MVRVDVFHIEDDGYYFIPIYTVDTTPKELPVKACVAGKSVKHWKAMDDKDFLFSLYPGDLIRIESSGKIKLKKVNKDADGKLELHRKHAYLYYVKSGISTASWTVATHDRRYFCASLGVKTLRKIEKYEVDVLGNYHKVVLPEKRQAFR